ncbi:MAG: hypothetical protein Q7L19_04045 [Pseudohongiella sp.]|nr:hypothetical protein [Pseudohongiella sp.]
MIKYLYISMCCNASYPRLFYENKQQESQDFYEIGRKLSKSLKITTLCDADKMGVLLRGDDSSYVNTGAKPFYFHYSLYPAVTCRSFEFNTMKNSSAHITPDSEEQEGMVEPVYFYVYDIGSAMLTGRSFTWKQILVIRTVYSVFTKSGITAMLSESLQNLNQANLSMEEDKPSAQVKTLTALLLYSAPGEKLVELEVGTPNVHIVVIAKPQPCGEYQFSECVIVNEFDSGLADLHALQKILPLGMPDIGDIEFEPPHIIIDTRSVDFS